MSKSFKSSLTGSRKKRVRPYRSRRQPQPKPATAWIDTLDAIDERCHRIETMAGLLRACDEPEEMNARLAARAGGFMADDLREVKALLAGLGKGTP
jgi:hypothetical protein